jgi:hypothetical protein
MTIATLALRLITVAALKGATRAGASVGDSQLGANHRQDGLAIAVHVDGVSQQGGLPEAAKQGEGSAHLVIELAYLVSVGAGADGWGAPPTDAVLEARLDLLEREVCAVLLHGGGVWAELWRRCIIRHVAYEMKRGETNLANGVRFAGREINMRLGLIAEPPLAEAPSGLWADFLAALADDPEFEVLEPEIVAAFAAEASPSWGRAKADLGVSREVVDGLGVSPPFDTDEEAPPIIEIRVDGEDEVRVIEG